MLIHSIVPIYQKNYLMKAQIYLHKAFNLQINFHLALLMSSIDIICYHYDIKEDYKKVQFEHFSFWQKEEQYFQLKIKERWKSLTEINWILISRLSQAYKQCILLDILSALSILHSSFPFERKDGDNIFRITCQWISLKL